MIPTWLSPVADWASLLGFVFTVWVLVVTRRLRREFTLRGRVPDLRRALSKLTAAISDKMIAWPTTKSETAALLARVRALLENLEIKLPRNERVPVAALIERLRGKRVGWLRRLPLSAYTNNEIWDIFADIQGIVAGLEQREKDATWS